MKSAPERWQRVSLPSRAPSGVGRPIILESWERSRLAGVEACPEDVRFRRVSDADLARRLRDRAELIRLAEPHLEWLHWWLADIPHVVYLVDQDAIVLTSLGTDDATMRAQGLLPGYDWSERVMGTNGPGTALAVDQPVAVIGSEHYALPWHGVT